MRIRKLEIEKCLDGQTALIYLTLDDDRYYELCFWSYEQFNSPTIQSLTFTIAPDVLVKDLSDIAIKAVINELLDDGDLELILTNEYLSK